MAAKILHKLEMTAPEEMYDRVLALLALEVSFGWEEQSLHTGETVFRVYCDNAAFLDRLKTGATAISPCIKITRSSFEEQPWNMAWRKFFTPVVCGSQFVILPPWLKDESYPERRKIIIEPEYAFGTGHHATTTLCLNALSNMLDSGRLRRGDTFLDLGCGSGVLGLGACLAGLTGLGVDIDELAIANARKNKELNLADGLALKHGSIEQAKEQKFTLVMANILARPLIELAPAIKNALAENGCLILSGILDIQADQVEQAFLNQGLPASARLADGEWRALVWA